MTTTKNKFNQMIKTLWAAAFAVVAALSVNQAATADAKVTPQYYTGLAKVTPIIKDDQKAFLVDFGGQVALVIDRPQRKHSIVDSSDMAAYINASGESTVVIFRSYKNPHRRFEFAPEGNWQVGPDGVTLNTGWHMHHAHHECKHKHYHAEASAKAGHHHEHHVKGHHDHEHHAMPSSQASEPANADVGSSTHEKTKSSHHHHAKHHKHHHHSHLWKHLTEEKTDGLMAVTVLMYKGEGEQDFFVTPKEFEFSALKAGEDMGHVVVKAVHPIVEAVSISTHCKHCTHKHAKGEKCHHHHAEAANHAKALATADCPAHAVSKHLTMAHFDKMWKSKAKDSFGKDHPNGFVWADFGTHAVLMTVVIGAPKGDRIPLTILDAHLVSDQGTQHIATDLDKTALAQLLVDGKKAKGSMMVDSGGCPSGTDCSGSNPPACCFG